MINSELKKYAKENKFDSASVLAGYNLARDEVKQVLFAGENIETGELLRMVGLDILPVELAKENKELSNSVTELTNTKTELENKVTELNEQIEKMKNAVVSPSENGR